MINQLVAALRQELGLTSKEIADTVWLALKMESSELSSTAGKVTDVEADTKSKRGQSLHRDVRTADLDSEPEEPLQGVQPAAELHTPNFQSENADGLGSELMLKVPDARSLREPLSLAKSLKPLLQTVTTGWSTELDEAATVERIADEGIWMPVLQPALEPWLDLALVVDESLSMHLWQRTITELQRLLAKYGVFRDVRVWSLVTDDDGQVKLQPRLAAARRQTLHRPSELIDATGRRLILIATDCVSAIWRNGTVLPTLKLWTASGPTAIVQMLPEWLWARTGLGFASAVRLHALMPGVPNQQLDVRGLSSWDEMDLESGVRMPVVTLEPEPFLAWAKMVSAKEGTWALGFVFEPDGVPSIDVAQLGNVSLEGSAEQRVQRFRSTASPMARRLAGLLAAAPVISLPIVRIIRDRLLSQSRQMHIAEVFLGGLLRPLSEIQLNTNPDAIQYDFFDSLRDIFLESVPAGDSLNVIEEVSTFVAERLGLSLDAFAASLKNPKHTEEQDIAEHSRTFAMVTASILRKLGGSYAKFAVELEQANQANYQRNSDFQLDEIEFKYQIGGSLPSDAPSYVKRQADEELYQALKQGRFCYALGSRQMGRSSLRVQAMTRLVEEGVACATVDITMLGASPNVTEDQWYAGFVRKLLRNFDLSHRVDLKQWWQERTALSPVQRFGEFIEAVLLVELSQPIVIFVDEIDAILNLSFSLDDLFLLIQEYYEQRTYKAVYTRLNFCVMGTCTPLDLITDVKRTPFISGVEIELKGFQFDEAKILTRGFSEKVNNSLEVLQEILKWTSGQPFLTQKVCRLVGNLDAKTFYANEVDLVGDLIRENIMEEWEKQDEPQHLKTISDCILRAAQERPEILTAYKNILESGRTKVENSLEQPDLILSGLVCRKGKQLKVSNKIYEEVFNRSWVDGVLSHSTRNFIQSVKVFMSYEMLEPDSLLAKAFYVQLKAAGHEVFMAAESIRLGDNWVQRINTALEHADYFILLMSPRSIRSEMVVEEVRQVKYLHDAREECRPTILPIRVNLPINTPLSYDLQGYLKSLQQGIWESELDTPRLLAEVLQLIREKRNSFPLASEIDEAVAQATAFDTQDRPPLPVSQPELPGGQVALDSNYYIERPPVEVDCHETVMRPGAIIRIKAPRLMGKTSLMSRILQHALENGCQVVPLSFQLAGAEIFTDLDKFLRWFCVSVGRRLRLPNGYDLNLM